MEDGQEVLVDVDVKVKPLNGYWKKTNGQEAVVSLKQSHTVKYYKKLPDDTSKASSGIHKNTKREGPKKLEAKELSKETAVSSTVSSGAYKKKDYHLSSTTPSMSSASGQSWRKVTFPKTQNLEKKRSRTKSCLKKSVTETKKEEPKKVEMKLEAREMETEESCELEYWTVLSLLWFFLFILRYFFVLEDEVNEGL